MPRDNVPAYLRDFWARFGMETDIPATSLEWFKAAFFAAHTRETEIQGWWDALGHYKDLQSDMAYVYDWMCRVGAPHPSAPDQAIVAVDEIQYAIGQVRAKYPHLLLYAPGVTEAQFMAELVYALQCGAWKKGEEPLIAAAARADFERRDHLRADVWRIDWWTADGPASRDVPVLAERLWQAHDQIQHQEQQLAIVVTVPADATDEEIGKEFQRALKQARTVVPGGSVQKPGVRKDYRAMVDLYQAAKDLDNPSNIKGWNSEKFKVAEKWLQPSYSSAIVLEQSR